MIWMISATLLLIIIGLWLQWRKKNFSVFQELGIPGPKPSIFFGNLWEMYRSTPIKCEEKWIKKYGKVVGYYFGFRPMLIVADVDLAKQIQIKDFHKFPNRPQLDRCHFILKKKEALTAQLTLVRNKRWKEIRSIITPSFTTSKMKMMYPSMGIAVDSLMDVIERNSKRDEHFDIYELYQKLTIDVISRTAFGIQTDVQNDSDDPAFKAVKVLFGQSFHSFFRVLKLSFPEISELWGRLTILHLSIQSKGQNPMSVMLKHAKNVINLRRTSDKARRQDLLQIMMDAKISESELNSVTNEDLTVRDIGNEDRKDENEIGSGTNKKILTMTDNEILDNTVLFFLAGYETTSTALAFVTHFIIHYPDVQQKLRKEINSVIEKEGKLDYNSVQQLKYLEQVIMEALRICPPVYSLVSREAEENIQYGQYKILKGMTIQIPVYFMNHDPNEWENPENFDPMRFSPENKGKINSMAFQTFGVGPRNCVGIRFAQLEMKLALANILSKYQLMKVKETDKDPISLKVRPGVLCPAKGIILKAIPV